MLEKPEQGPLNSRVGYIITLGIIAKLIVDTTVQIFNPFLTMIAAGIGIGIVQMGRIVAFRNLMGFTAPIFGSLSDKIGYKTVMRISLLLGGIGFIIAAVFQNVPAFIIAMAFAGAGQAGYTPTLHAYLSSKLPYNKRARGIGIVEYSWALAGIIGLFAAGYLIEVFSWRAPFFLFGGLLIGMSLFYGTLPRGERPEKEETSGPKEKRPFFVKIKQFLDLGPNAKSAWGTIAVTGLNFFAMMHVMITHGAWLEKEYALGPSQLGNVALLFGVCDLAASVLVSIAVDKIGKRRGVIIGVAGVAAGYALMPFLNVSLPLALVSLSLPRAFFEFATVSNFPLISEQVPQQRGKVLALSMTCGLIGSTAASATGPAAFLRFGVWGLAPVGFAAAAVNLLLLLFIVKERQPD